MSAEPSCETWSVYVLLCSDGSLYTGATNDLSRRLARHNMGRGAAYTRARLPVTLLYSELAGDHGAALRREAAIKRLPRRGKVALLEAAGIVLPRRRRSRRARMRRTA